MRRLLLIDDVGGRIAALVAGVALLEGAPGFQQVLACARGTPDDDPVIPATLDEIGLKVAPLVHDFATVQATAADHIVSLGQSQFPGAAAHWHGVLPARDAHPLVQRSAARLLRDQLARRLPSLAT